MKYVARIVPLLILLAVVKQACRAAARHRRAHEAEGQEFEGATL